MKRVVLITLLALLLYGFGEERRLLQTLPLLPGKVVSHSSRGGLLFATDLYRIKVELGEGNWALLRLQLRRARLPIGKGVFSGEVEELHWNGRRYTHLFRFTGETRDFRRFDYILSPTQLGGLSLPTGRGSLWVEGQQLRGTLQFPTFCYSFPTGKVVGEFLQVEFQWGKKGRRQLVTVGKIAGEISDGVVVEGEGLNWEGILERGKGEVKGFCRQLRFRDTGGGVIELSNGKGELQIFGEGSTLRELFRLGRKWEGRLEVKGVSANRTPIGYLKLLFQLEAPQPIGVDLIKGETPPDLSLNLVVEGSERLIEGLKEVIKNPVTALLLENLQPVDGKERVSISVKGGEVLVNGNRTLP